MPKVQRFWWLIVWALIGCGPDTILLRPAIDTPAQHVANGNELLQREKWGDARREFERAKELDPFCTEAYVGLAIALGRNGDFETAAKIMDQARQTASGEAARAHVVRGDDELHRMIEDQGYFK